MNSFAHFFLNYFLLSFIISNINDFLIPIIIFSIILDLDHLIGYKKLLKIPKKVRIKERWREHTLKETLLVRTIIQEPFGIIILSLMILAFCLLGFVKPVIAFIAISCFVLHWMLDFLTNITLPLRPVSMKAFNPLFKSDIAWEIKEFVLTFIFCVLFGLVYFM